MVPKDLKKLDKFICYVLCRRPDEFGLIPDREGFVKIKTLLQALHEEPGSGHIRRGHLNTLVAALQPASLEIVGDLIRARHRGEMPAIDVPAELPKLLYTSIRRRAYRTVHEKGIRPGGHPYILLSPEPDLALRLGRRIDNDPVLLTVQVAKSVSTGSFFRKFGELLYLADRIPPGTFSGPPLPKEPPLHAGPQKEPEPRRNETPGSYFPDVAGDEAPNLPPHARGRRDRRDWKKERRQARKEKSRRQGG